MTLTSILTSSAAGAVYLLLACAAISATAAATRLTHPRLSAWLSFFAAALPADVVRMKLGPAPPAVPPVPPPVAAEGVVLPEQVFQAVANREITPAEGAELLTRKP